MMKFPHLVITAFLAVGGLSLAQTTPPAPPAAPAAPAPTAPPVQLTPEQAQDAQRQAMKALAWMDGLWRGPATVLEQDGKRLELIHTERVGSFLDGTVKVIEGRSYSPDGNPGGFNAFAIVSYNPYTKKYEFRTYSGGNSGTFDIMVSSDGYQWAIPAGPDQTVQYVATFKDGTWAEKGTFNAPNQPALPIFEMNLKRVGDTDWPLGTPVPAN